MNSLHYTKCTYIQTPWLISSKLKLFSKFHYGSYTEHSVPDEYISSLLMMSILLPKVRQYRDHANFAVPLHSLTRSNHKPVGGYLFRPCLKSLGDGIIWGAPSRHRFDSRLEDRFGKPVVLTADSDLRTCNLLLSAVCCYLLSNCLFETGILL